MLRILKESIEKKAEVDMVDVGIAKNRVGNSFEVFIPGTESLGVTDRQFDIFNAIEEVYEIKDWEFTQKDGKRSQLRIRFDMKDELAGLICLLTEKMEELNEVDKLWQKKTKEVKKIQKQIEVCING